jgi:2-aminoadipate transaminase
VRSARMDEEGLRLDELESALAGGADLLYTIPTFQNPGGSTLSEERRDGLLELARAAGAVVFEDDPYGDLWFDAPPPARLFGRAAAGDLVYSSSFSKTASPGLRVGYLVLPESLAGDVATRANDTYISPSFVGQAALHEFALSGGLERSIETSRGLLRERCDLLTSAIDRTLPEARYVRPAGGYFLWLTLPDGLRASELVAPAAELGVTFVAGDAFGDGNDNAMRLAFSSPPKDLIATGVERLAQAAERIGARA